jgi:hypothetical protein
LIDLIAIRRLDRKTIVGAFVFDDAATANAVACAAARACQRIAGAGAGCQD